MQNKLILKIYTKFSIDFNLFVNFTSQTYIGKIKLIWHNH